MRQRRLGIAIVTTQKLWHGGEEQASLLIDGLRNRGHDCRVLSRQGSVFATRMEQRGYEVATFRGRGRLPNAMWQVRRVLSVWRPDVIYMNDPHALTAAGLAAIGLGPTLRVAVRRVDFPLRNASRYRRLADVALCVSNAVRSVCLQSGLASDSLVVVPDGVDPHRMSQGNRQLARHSLGLAANQKLFLTVARLADHKGHRYLLDALPWILNRNPDFVFAFAGDGQLWETLRGQARRLGLGNRVLFLGYRDDVPDLLAGADCLVVPSQLEGLCSSIIDAMMVGLPVVATTAGGIPDLLARRDGQPACGWLVPPRSSVALAAGIDNVFRFPHLTTQYIETAKHRAYAEFTAERMVDRTLQVFRTFSKSKSIRLAG